MLKIIISGSSGRMGQNVARLCSQDENVKIVAGFDPVAEKLFDFPVYTDPMEFLGEADVIIDFSSPSGLESLISYCLRRRIPAVLCTTGYTTEQKQFILNASKQLPLFMSANMSLGINVLAALIKKAAAALGDNYDIEIIEKHHNKKIDAPSGTALLLADAVSEATSYEPEYVYDRQSVRKARAKNEIGISAVRGGTIPGEHEIIFAGPDEVIEFKHSVYSRDVFASGAIRAAKFLAGCEKAGLYDMNNIFNNL